MKKIIVLIGVTLITLLALTLSALSLSPKLEDMRIDDTL